ncbi:GntR family transcriptional regulator [Catenovulum sp. 2E275]|uniref:GntR family transcriptional regulator n=1 Tax=Catenovulum sp. 2E275 TaxID=2980497 RepID=UPI0021D39962|nr:GntR family transcriptional regulator [Catenovulum sp. 2E275]MCU4677704.1 GntR family transcriptional regulator [Catenovulum sp. 2E275]
MAVNLNPTSEPVFTYLHEQIISMQILPGQKLSENSLSKQFQVSRTPIREVIAKLVSLGLVEVKVKSGTFVSKLSIEKITEAQFIREAIETAIVSKVASAKPQKTIVECEEIIEQQRIAAAENHAIKFQYLDDKFHQTLADFTGFDRAASIIQFEKAHLDRVRNLSLKEFGGQYDRVLTQHKQILNAIKQQNPQQAAEYMALHTREILTVLEQIKAKHADYF